MKGRLQLSSVLTLCLALTLVGAVPLMASAGLTTEQWVARYNSLGVGDDSTNAIAVDSSGNVYVTGRSEGSGTGDDYATVKYDTAGNQLWIQRYSSPGSGWDQAYAIAVDTSGNVYVTGVSKSDYATIKYDTNGNQLWVAQYNGPESSDDEAYAIAVDLLGNVYVTGWSRGSETSWDYATVKYDTDGNQLWVARYNDPADGEERAEAIAVDSSGNVYVTGTNATLKYDTDGNQLWMSQHPANAISVDPSGNVYVTGWGYTTVKYDTNGTEFWVARYNSPGDGYGSASAIAVDLTGNVYVTGHSPGIGTGDDYATVKYDSDGNQLWVKRYNGPVDGEDSANAISIDASGNVYVTGESRGSGTRGDYTTVKYDTDGNELWVKRYNSPGNGDDRAHAMAVDALGNVYVTGGSRGSETSWDYATVKYDINGNPLWGKRYNGSRSGSDSATTMAIDASGNVYVTGTSEYDYATVKYDPDGNELWMQRYNGPLNGWDFATAIDIDAFGNVYVTGGSEGKEGFWDAWDDYATVKYDTDGNKLWVKGYNGPGNGWDEAHAMAVDASGNVYVTGESPGSETGDDYATVKYDTHGNELWVKRYNGPANSYDRANAIAVDAGGNVYVAGESSGGETGYDYATVKYDTLGNELWVARYNGPASSDDEATSIAVDLWSNVYVTGGSESDYATVKYDSDGNELWVKRYNGPGNDEDSATAMAVDAWGNVYVTGGSEGSGTGSDYATVKYAEGVKMDLPAGWSMISLPVRPAVATVTTLFPEAVVVYRYQKGAGYMRVQAGENLEVGMGYWILLDNPHSYVIKGTEIPEYTIPVNDGWYMIGGCSMPAQRMVTSGSIYVVYGYTQGKGYTRVPESQLLEGGKGYWILFSDTSEGTEFTASTSVSE